MSNPFENLDTLINGFENSERPEDRLVYLKSIKRLIEIGEKLYQLKEDEDLKKNVWNLKKIAENYELYPKLKGIPHP